MSRGEPRGTLRTEFRRCRADAAGARRWTTGIRLESTHSREAGAEPVRLSLPVVEPMRYLEEIGHELRELAPLSTAVLITGETGVGKSVAARKLHDTSPRHASPFVHVDCGSLATGLFESELFGHERGAFTGAAARHAGRLERAHRGTLFLDEIGELSLSLQAKLLHVLQERVYERVGGSEPLVLDARLVVATNRDLAREVTNGRFRADLYYRIAVARIRILPLRMRRTEIPALVCSGLDRLKPRLGLPLPIVSEAALERLSQEPWPGNIRQLFNVLERLAIRNPGRRVGVAEVAAELADEPCFEVGVGGVAACLDETGRSLPADFERRVRAALRESGGNVAGAARRLGLPRTTLRRRMQSLGIARLDSGDSLESLAGREMPRSEA